MKLAGRLGWRVLNAVMTALFAFGAVVQLNDPDPILWTALYLAAAASSLASALAARAFIIAAPTGIAALVWASTLGASMRELAPIPSLFEQFEMKDVAIEETRELLGLGIIALWMLVVSVVSRRAQGLASSSGSARSSI